MAQPTAVDTLTAKISGSVELGATSVEYIVDGEGINFRGGYQGLSWIPAVPENGSVVFISSTNALGKTPADLPLFWRSSTSSSADILTIANGIPNSPRNFTNTSSAYEWALDNSYFVKQKPFGGFFISNARTYLDPNHIGSYPTTGTNIYDLSGYRYDAVLNNSPTYNSLGWLDFDGTDDNIAVEPNSYRSTQTPGTIEAVFNIKNYADPQVIVGTTENRDRIISIVDGGHIRGCQYNGTLGLFCGGQYRPIVQDKFHHVALTYTVNNGQGTSEYALWVDGVKEAEQTPSTTTTVGNDTNANTLGGTGFNFTDGGAARNNFGGTEDSTGYFSGSIERFLTHEAFLTDAQILQNYYQAAIETDNLVFGVDAFNVCSYPKYGTTTFDLSPTKASGSFFNNIKYYKDSGGRFENPSGSGIYFNQGALVPNITGSEFSATVTFRYSASNGEDRNVLLSKGGCYELSINNITGQCQYYVTTEDQAIASFPGKQYIVATDTYNVVAFEDNTKIYVNGTYDSTLNAYQPTTKGYTQGDVITSNKPLGIKDNNTSRQPAYEKWKGTQFMWRCKRPPNDIYIFSPDGTAVVDLLRNGSVFSSSVSITQDNYISFNQASAQQITVRSVNGLPVCINQDTGADMFSPFPADYEMFGWISSTFFAYPLTGSTQTVLYGNNSNSSTLSSFTLPTDTGSYTNSSAGLASGNDYSGYPNYISSSNNLFFADTYADTDGGDQTSWVTRRAFASKFVLTEDADHVAFLSDGVTPLEVKWYDQNRNLKVTMNSNGFQGKGTSDYVSGIYTGSDAVTAQAGDFFITNKPAHAIMDGNGDDEIFIAGAYRMFSGGPDVTDGEWHQMTVTKNGSLEQLYVDGALVGTFTGTTGDVWNEDNRINIGGIGGDTQPGTNFVGDIANVFIYNADIGGQAVSNYTELVSRFIG